MRKQESARTSFAADLLASLREERARALAVSLGRSSLILKDEDARRVAHTLDAQALSVHVAALSAAFGVPAVLIRAAVALEVARALRREKLARSAVAEVAP